MQTTVTVVDQTFQGLAGSESDLFFEKLAGLEGLGVEIGCLDGYSTTTILTASKLTLVSIDPFIPDSMEKSLVGSKDRFFKNVLRFGDRSRLIQDYSHDVIKSWPESKKLDFLFIDGDHTRTAVAKDYDDWTPLLKIGGLLAMHDSRMHRSGGAPFHQGSSEIALERVFSDPLKWDIIGEAFSLTIARKLT